MLAQTYAEWELILVDDGSTDRASAIAQSFSARHPERIRYLEHPGHVNLGMSASRNLGLKHVRGDYVSYLDADDVWRPEKLTEQLRLLEENPTAAYSYGPLEIWRSWTGRPSDVDELQELGLSADRLVEPPELLKLFLQNERFIPSGVLFRTETFTQNGGYDSAFTGMYEDLVMHAKVCLSQPVLVSSKSWYRYRQHPDSCNARAWRTGEDQLTRLSFLRWFERYLIEVRQAEGEVWDILQEQLRGIRPASTLQRFPGMLRRQASRAKRVVRASASRVRRALSAPPLILCYHRVFTPQRDPHLLSVTPEHFRAQLEILRAVTAPISLDRLSDPARRPPAGGVVLTFDDGYLDNLEMALPILREFAIPATIYIATGYVNSEREFWWDDLERLLLGPAELPRILRLQIGGRRREWDLGDDGIEPDDSWNVLAPTPANARQRLFVELHSALRPLPEAQQIEVLEQLRAFNQTPVTARPLHRCVNTSELQKLAADPLITLGAHTITHCDLDYRTADEQWAEIDGSRRQLESFIDHAVEHFSYPYGSLNDSAVANCAQGKFRSAVSCVEEPVTRQSPPHCLPRFLVRDWDGAEFEQHLRQYIRG